MTRIAVVCRLEATNPRDFVQFMVERTKFDIDVITDRYQGQVNCIDESNVHHYAPTNPMTVSRFRRRDRVRYRRLLQNVDADAVILLGICDFLFLHAHADAPPTIFRPQGGETSRAAASPEWTNSTLKKLYFRLAYRPMFSELLHSVDEVWGVQQENEVLYERLGLDPQKFRPFDCGMVDVERFAPSQNSKDVIEEDKTVIGSFTRIRGNKLAPSFQVGLDAIGILAERRDDFHVVIGGFYEDGSSRVVEQVVDKKIDKYGLEDTVTKLGLKPKEEMPEYYNSLDIYLKFNHKGLSLKSFGTAPKEAMACGCPIISFDDPPAGHIIRQGGNGFVVPYEADSLRERLTYLIDNSDEREAMGHKARVTIEENFSETVVANRIEKFVGHLLDN